jgi:hypothetical protein
VETLKYEETEVCQKESVTRCISDYMSSTKKARRRVEAATAFGDGLPGHQDLSDIAQPSSRKANYSKSAQQALSASMMRQGALYAVVNEMASNPDSSVIEKEMQRSALGSSDTKSS